MTCYITCHVADAVEYGLQGNVARMHSWAVTFLSMTAGAACPLIRSPRSKTFEALFFDDLWQNLCGPSKDVFIDGVGLVCSAPETHLMLSCSSTLIIGCQWVNCLWTSVYQRRWVIYESSCCFHFLQELALSFLVDGISLSLGGLYSTLQNVLILGLKLVAFQLERIQQNSNIFW